MQRGQPTTHALADDAFGAAEFGCDFGVTVLLEVVGLDRRALLRGESLEELTAGAMRSLRGSRSPRRRAVSAASRALAARRPGYGCCAAPRSTCGARSRTAKPGPVPVRARKRGTEAAQPQTSRRRDQCLLGAGHPTTKEGKHRSEMPLVEDSEWLRACARRKQKLGVGALLPVAHASYMTISREL